MSILRVLSSRGDDHVSWDVAKAQSGDVEAIAAVREAERIFAEQRSKGATAFAVTPGVPATRIDDFDLEREQIIMVPVVRGG